MPRPMFVRPRNVRCAQPMARCRREVGTVAGDHQAFPGFETKSIDGIEIDLSLGFVIARKITAENRVPREIIAAREIDLQSDVSVGQRRNTKLRS